MPGTKRGIAVHEHNPYFSDISRAYNNTERRGPMKARVAIARRMLVSIHHMLTEQADYRHQDRDLVKRKLQRIRRVAESPE